MKTNLSLLTALLLMPLAALSAAPPLPAGVRVTDPAGNPLRAAIRPVPASAIFKMDGWYLWDPSVIKAGGLYHVVCTDWEGKATGIQKAMVYYTSKDGTNYGLVSQEPVWSQNDPLPLSDGHSLTVAGVERPQVCLDERGAVVALLAAAYPAKGSPPNTFIIIRPVERFLPAGETTTIPVTK